jgi:sulfide:quinone oxidoreductase
VVAQRITADIQRTKPEAYFDGLGFCWIEMGGGVAGFASGNFYAEPDPVIKLSHPGRLWHWGKIEFENYWMGDSLRKQTARWALNLGSKFFHIPTSL